MHERGPLEYEERIGLRRLVAQHAPEMHKRVERLEIQLDRLAGLAPKTGYAAAVTHQCQSCGIDHELETEGCALCRTRHYNRNRRAIRRGLVNLEERAA